MLMLLKCFVGNDFEDGLKCLLAGRPLERLTGAVRQQKRVFANNNKSCRFLSK